MALFSKKPKTLEEVIADFEKLSDEEKEQFKSHITKSETEKVEDEPAVEEEVETETETEETEDAPEVEETEDEAEVETEAEAEAPVEDEAPAEPEETETEEVEEVDAEEVEDKAEEEADARDAKLEALLDEFKIYKEKVDKLYSTFEENDKPAEEVGLARQDGVGDEKDDEELSAYEYARKYGKY